MSYVLSSNHHYSSVFERQHLTTLKDSSSQILHQNGIQKSAEANDPAK